MTMTDSYIINFILSISTQTWGVIVLATIFTILIELGRIENETRKKDKDDEPFIRG